MKMGVSVVASAGDPEDVAASFLLIAAAQLPFPS